ncbi:hypothetical protein [Tardibacter chloracetimidivorans]|nr:hypothetical protein [Tardibacter chloracetimidivorans]
MTQRLRPSALWDRTAACLRENLTVLLPVGGVFFFLPSVIMARLMPAGPVGSLDLGILLPIGVMLLFQTIGQLTVLLMVLDPHKPTVREALNGAMRALAPAIGVQFAILSVVCAFLIVGQLIAMLFAGGAAQAGDTAAMTRLAVIGMVIAGPAILYALARLAVVFPALLLERLTPLEALRRAFRLTSGSAVPILALILVATFLYLFLQLALGTAVGGVFMLLGRLIGVESLGLLFTLVLTAALGTVANLVITVALGFAYRELART